MGCRSCISFVKLFVCMLIPLSAVAERVEFMGGVVQSTSSSDGALIEFDIVDASGKVLASLDPCEEEGGNPQVAWVVVDNTKKYLAITCCWRMEHAGLGMRGTLYETRVYHKPIGDGSATVMEKIMSNELSGFEGQMEDGPSHFYFSSREPFVRKLNLLATQQQDDVVLVQSILLARFKGSDADSIEYYAELLDLEVLITASPVSSNTVPAYNDVGFVFCEMGQQELGLKILRQVEMVEPERLVLALNLADCLWGEGRFAEAREYYKKYADVMNRQRKAGKIPGRVSDRLNQSAEQASPTKPPASTHPSAPATTP